MIPLLSIVTWLPFLGAILILMLGKSSPATARSMAVVTAVLNFGLSLALFGKFEPGSFHFQNVESYPWISAFGINYSIGVDGVSIWLVVLTAFMSIFAVAMSRYIEHQVHLFMALLLMLETFMIGAFGSLDLILFFTFFELTLFPTYFLIAIWGGERRSYAAAKFFIYTFAGSIFLLIGILFLGYQVSPGPSFSLVSIQRAVASGTIWHGGSATETLVFWAFAIAFLIKAPAFPFHTWMPDMYGESPSVVPVVSGVMVKLGTFGLLRFCIPLFPEAIQSQAPILMGLAVTGIVYAGIIAVIQPDMRRLVAYSSISHMGFVMLGLFSLTVVGFSGGAFQQISHSVVAGALLMLLAFVWERRRTAEMAEYGGLKLQMPIFAALLLIVVLASAGLPGTNGFVGEFLALMGSFESASRKGLAIAWLYPAAAAFGVVLSAAYLLYLYQRLCYGNARQPSIRLLRDLKPWEVGLSVCLIAVILLGGLWPSTFLKPMQASLEATRLMALSPEGHRPVWGDEGQAVDMVEGSPTYGAVTTASPSGPVALAPAGLLNQVVHHR